MLGKAAEKDQIIVDVLGQMSFNLSTMWFPAYEQLNFGEAQLIPYLNEEDKLPTNRTAVITEVTTMMMTDPPLLSATTGREILSKELGVPFASDELTRIIQETAAKLALTMPDPAAADPQGARLATEAANASGNAAQ